MQWWSGRATNPGLTLVDTKAFAVDAQAQGEVAAMPLGIYLTYAKASGSTVGANPNFFNANVNAMKAATIAGQLGVLPGRATLLMAYRKGDNGKATGNGDNSLMLGVTYLVAQNVQLQLNHERYSGNACIT